jgi:hypothetical protein
MKEWAVAFIAAVLVAALIVWCAYILIPLFRSL